MLDNSKVESNRPLPQRRLGSARKAKGFRAIPVASAHFQRLRCCLAKGDGEFIVRILVDL
jgi:hypothetical protein